MFIRKYDTVIIPYYTQYVGLADFGHNPVEASFITTALYFDIVTDSAVCLNVYYDA